MANYSVEILNRDSGATTWIEMVGSSAEDAKSKASAAGMVVGRVRATDAQTKDLPRIASTSSIAWVALLVAILALFPHVLPLVGVRLNLDGLGRGMGAYDFSTPVAAMRSQIKMLVNQDLRGLIQYKGYRESRGNREALSTMSVSREEEAKGKVFLFVSYEMDGVTEHEVNAFEKDAKSGLWFDSPFYTFDFGDEDKPLRDRIEAWRSRDEP
jgi:hypothetical protein